MNEIIVEEKTATTEIKNLLENISIIQKKYDDIAEITGEKFNVFSVLNLTSNEVRTHSSFIGELLNIKGSHGLKNIPLKLFIKMLEEKFIPNEVEKQKIKIESDRFKIDTETSKTIVEKYIGKLKNNKTDGGRIDIIVEDYQKRALIIENKIYAGEQENQLIRYNNYNKEAPILFLTLKGSKPNSAEGLIENKDYFNISYKNDILKWLEDCAKEAINKPMLREVLKQYIYLIKKLTGQTLNKVMSTEIQNIILNNFSAAERIVKEFDGIKYKICGGIREDIITKLKAKLLDKYDVSKKESNVGDKNSKIWIELNEFSGNSLLFGIEPFSGNGNKGSELFYGIIDLHSKNQMFFEDTSDFIQNGWWREKKYFNYFENFKVDFSDTNFISFLGKDEKKRTELVSALSDQIIEYIESKEDYLTKIHKQINETQNR